MSGWELISKGRKLGMRVTIGIHDQQTHSVLRFHLGEDIVSKMSWKLGDYLNIHLGSGDNEGKIRLIKGNEDDGHLLGQDLKAKYFRLTWGNYPKEWTRDARPMRNAEMVIGDDYLILDVPSLIIGPSPN